MRSKVRIRSRMRDADIDHLSGCWSLPKCATPTSYMWNGAEFLNYFSRAWACVCQGEAHPFVAAQRAKKFNDFSRACACLCKGRKRGRR